MAHNINTYIGRQSAWHALGTVTGRFMTWKDLLAHGGLDFDVVKQQLEFGGKPIDAWGIFRWDLDDKAADDETKMRFLGTVGKDYTPIHHGTGFEMIDALVASTDGAHYETAGVLGEGEKVWGLADLGLAVRVGDDKQDGYLLFSTSHDGSMSYSYRTCFTRVVCQNTLTSALSEKAKAAFSIRHTTNSGKRIADAHQVLANMGDDIKRVEDKLNFLAGRKMTREACSSIFDRLFPKRLKDDGSAVAAGRRENILADVLKIYELNDGNVFPEQRGTAYNLLNAITNYTDHERSSRGDRRAESALFGSGDTLKTKAFEVLVETAGGLPSVPVVRYDVARAEVKPGVPVLDQILAIA